MPTRAGLFSVACRSNSRLLARQVWQPDHEPPEVPFPGVCNPIDAPLFVTYFYKVLVHVLLVMLSFIGAYSLRRGLGPEWWLTSGQAGLVLSWAVLYGAIAGAIEVVFKNERSAWSFASMVDVTRLLRATGLTALTFLALIFVSNRGITLPRSTLLLSWLLSFSALVGIRLTWRMRVEGSFLRVFTDLSLQKQDNGRALVLVGSPLAASAYMKRHNADDAPFSPVGIVVTDPALVGQIIHGIRVLGVVNELESVARTFATQSPPAALLFLGDPVTDLRLEVDVVGRLRAANHLLLRLPNVTEMKAGTAAPREIDLEEFLPREPVMLDPTPLEDLVEGRRVLVTGAGGSIGSEICRQLVGLGCEHITLVDHSEFLLFEADRTLKELDEHVSKRALLGDVRDAARMDAILSEERPDIVFHAAALKHVALVEQNPCEAALTNIKGTWNVADASRRHGAAQFVLISTDKAVDPTSFMGATKRMAETLLPASESGTRYCVVRFGNVLGSAGSVVPIFRKQIERGGPVTVTHRDVERYFMTIPEAVQLVLHAAAVSAREDRAEAGNRKFLLEMGKPVKIHDLARQMIELYGLRPDVDIQVQFTGLKVGEKLTEELMDVNERARARGIGLSEVETLNPGTGLDPAEIEKIADLARRNEKDAVRRLVALHISRIRSGKQ